TRPDHRVVSIVNQISQNGDLLSISWDDGSGVVQIYNAEGALEGLRLSDGTLLRIDESSLDRIVLSDGTVLTELVWNGTSLTGFRRTSADGQVEIYRNSKVIERIGADGVRTIFIDYRNSREPESLITEDGMTYRVIRYPNGEGLTERLTELVKIDLPGGGRIEFEQGRPVRYVQSRQVRIEPYEVPELLPGKHFVSVIELPNASLRSLTVDENGYIFSGEILFRDGTQCLIENNEIVKQITASGRFLEFSDAIEFQEPGPASPPEALTAAEAAYRRYLVEKQLGFFSEGKGLHAGTGLPLDNYLLAEDQQSDYSQATLVGFWAEILAAIAAGDFETPLVSRKQAFEKLEALLAVYQEVQRQAGWNGMVAFFRIIENEQPVLDESGEPTGEVIKTYRYENLSDQYGFGDTLNLAVSLSSVLGAVKNLSLEPDMTVLRESIVARANAILTAQEAGYAAFYDSVKKRFRGAYGLNPQTGQWEFVNNYYIDRLFNEFRPGMVWLAANYPEYQPAFDGLDVTIRRYLTEEGRAIELAAPFDGGTFQMFWPLIHVDETRYPEFNVALRNFLYVQAEYAFGTGNPGLLSAGDNPGYGYEGKIGLPAAAEADDVRHSDIGSIYGTASAFGLAPHYTLQFLKNLETSFPEIVTEAGFVDALSIRTVLHTDPVTGEILPTEEPVFSSQYFGVDQASFILSLLTTSRGYLRSYLMDRGVAERFDNLYGSFLLNLNPATDSALPMPPFGENVEVLYDGGSVMPDGKMSGLVKQPSFIPNVFDSRFGEGRVFNYRQPDGTFHHSAIEFGEGGSFREMDIQEYLLLTGHTDLGRALMGGFELDVYNRADSQGAFYTPLHGYAASELIRDPLLGEVRQIAFQFLDAEHPVGLWNKYSAAPLDLDRFDFLSVPVRVGDGTPENIRLKFEFKGTGNIFLTEPLKQGWQFITIPVVRPLDGRAEMITTVIQSANGEPVAGEIYIGPLSGFKVRTTNRLDWAMMLGKSEQEIRTLIRNGIVTEAFGGGVRDAEEILENFTIDSSGKLVSGILRRADGSIQYFENGLLSKWVFRNGRTVLYEKGIASFIIDLARGKLETGRFYYDQDLRGTIHSFNIQDNDRRRIFNTDGTLRTMIQDGNTVQMEGGRIISITTPQAILTGIEFGDDGNLIRAHAVLNDGREMDIDEFAGNRVSVGEGIWLYYRGTEITAVETLRNGRTDLVYRYDAAGRVVGVDAEFTREGEPVSMPLFEYLMLPERAAERAQLISRTLNVIAIPGSIVGEFSYPDHPQGEMIYARRADIGYDSQAYFMFQYQSTSTSHVLGMVFNHQNSPFEISDYGFLSVTLMQDPSMTWNQDFTFKIKGTGYNTLYAFSMKNLVPEYRTFWFPMAGKAGLEGEITLELVKESDGVGKEGCVYFKDVSYMSLKTFEEPLWEEQAGIRASRIRNLKIEAENLSSVGATIAAGTPLTFPGLLPYLDIPTRMIHTDTTAGANRLVTFRRFDGTRVELNGSEVTRVTLPNGIVNEYEFSENSAEISIGGPDHTSPDGSPAVSYSYGALRRIIQPDGRQYDLSYEFDSEGNEITVFTDPVSGEVRRFRGGKLLTSADPNGIVTHYLYSDEEIIGAELTYRNRVLNSTRYSYEGEETRITDERGTVWFYDADGKLIKHLTRDGYLYEYSDYFQTLPDGAVPDPGDYKNAAYAETGLRAVSLKGYQAPDGSWIIFEGDQGSEVHLASGATAVNLVFDEDQRIKAGQIQFSNGLILEIEDYVPVRGRLAEGSLFEQSLPQGTSREIVQDEEGGFLGFQCKVGDYTMTYNAAGELVRAETGAGASHYFTYTKDPGGRPTAATETALTQVAFNGVPFPKELELLAGSDQKILDSGKEIARHEGSGFLVGVYKESLNQWDVYSGSFSSQADRTGLEHFLSGVKAGESVAAIVSDPSFSGAGEGILSLFEGLGAGQVRQAASGNRKWTFFGNERLNAGEGRDAMDQASFSTVTKNVMTHSIDSDSHPTFRDAPMLLDFEMSVSRAYDSFLKEY
ncbi:MAG TPA: hypothetical protein PK997_06490, partial [Candidatus Omnitrophota bacterium]|nr:hypothetical protein [Candidatus Omnitrophota bacterium]